MLYRSISFLNNFENVVNRRVDIREDIKTLLVMHLSKLITVWERIFIMLSSDMNLKIRSGTVGYNNKILVSDGKFSLGKNVEVNAPTMKSHKVTQIADSQYVLAHAPNISHKNQEPQTITQNSHNDENLLWYWLWQVVLQFGTCFNKKGLP